MPPTEITQALTVREPDAPLLQTERVAVSRSQQIRVNAANSARSWSWKHFAVPTGIVLTVALAVVFFRPLKSLRSEHFSEAHQQPAAVVVNVARPAPATTASVVLPATVRPWQTTTLHARVTGYLAAWHGDLGAHVKAGELLAELETPELDQEVAQSEALAQEAAAAAVQAEAERTEAEAELEVTVAQLARTKAELELARTQLARREKLRKSGAVTEDEYDTFQKQWEARTAEAKAAESNVARRRANLKTRAAIIDAREATAKSRQANTDRLKELQRFNRIVAPFDGVVTQRSAEVGKLVTAGTDALFVIEDMSRVRVQVNVPQANAAQVGQGVEATVRVPESTAAAIRGSVTRITDSIDSTNRTMLAEIELDNATHRLQPGSYAQVTLTTATKNAPWTIPTNTLQMRIEGPHVVVVGRDQHVEIRRVTLGRNLGGRVVVSEGIRGDEELVVNPSDSLSGGQRVELKDVSIALNDRQS